MTLHALGCGAVPDRRHLAVLLEDLQLAQDPGVGVDRGEGDAEDLLAGRHRRPVYAGPIGYALWVAPRARDPMEAMTDVG